MNDNDKCPICEKPAECNYFGVRVCKKHWTECTGVEYIDT